MGVNPIPLLVILGLYLAFYGLMAPDTNACGTTSGANCGLADAPAVNQPDGIIDIVLGVINAVWGVVTFLYNAISFNIPGAPAWARVPIAVGFIGTLTWAIAGLVRGN
jgi:hypothetical protein